MGALFFLKKIKNFKKDLTNARKCAASFIRIRIKEALVVRGNLKFNYKGNHYESNKKSQKDIKQLH